MWGTPLKSVPVGIRRCVSNNEHLAVAVSCERPSEKRSLHAYTGPFLISSVSFTSFILFEAKVDLVHQTLHTSFPKDNNQLETTYIKTFIFSPTC